MPNQKQSKQKQIADKIKLNADIRIKKPFKTNGMKQKKVVFYD